jgi:hypothetical protein
MIYRSHGLEVVIEAEGELAGLVGSVLLYKAFERVEQVLYDRPMRLRLSTGETTLPAPEGEVLGRLDTGLTVYRCREKFVITDARSYVSVSPDTLTAEGVIAPSAPEARYNPAFYYVTISLLLLSRRLGYFPVHAGAVSRDGCTVLFLGDSDTGKSTTTMGLVRRGWQYLSDDSVALFDAEGSVGALSMRREFCVDADIGDRYPELLGHAWPSAPNDLDKWRVDPALLHPGCYLPSARPSMLVFPTLMPDEPTILMPAPAHLAVMLTSRHSMMPLAHDPTASGAHFALLGRLVSQCRTFQLRLGSDALDDSGIIERLLLAAAEPARSFA